LTKNWLITGQILTYNWPQSGHKLTKLAIQISIHPGPGGHPLHHFVLQQFFLKEIKNLDQTIPKKWQKNGQKLTKNWPRTNQELAKNRSKTG